MTFSELTPKEQQAQSIMGSQVEDWVQSSIEKMFNDVMFQEGE